MVFYRHPRRLGHGGEPKPSPPYKIQRRWCDPNGDKYACKPIWGNSPKFSCARLSPHRPFCSHVPSNDPTFVCGGHGTIYSQILPWALVLTSWGPPGGPTVGKGLNDEGGINLARLGLSWAELQPALRFRDKLGEVEKKSLVKSMHKIWEEQQLWNSILSYFQSKLATKETVFLYSDVTSMKRLFHRLFSAGGRTPGENTWESARITFSDSIFCTGTYVLNSL